VCEEQPQTHHLPEPTSFTYKRVALETTQKEVILNRSTLPKALVLIPSVQKNRDNFNTFPTTIRETQKGSSDP